MARKGAIQLNDRKNFTFNCVPHVPAVGYQKSHKKRDKKCKQTKKFRFLLPAQHMERSKAVNVTLLFYITIK